MDLLASLDGVHNGERCLFPRVRVCVRAIVDPRPGNIDLEMSPAAVVGVGHHVDLHLVKAALLDLEMRGADFPEVGHRRIEVCAPCPRQF
jgi:hypothetical protein